MLVSFIIPTYNNVKLLDKTLAGFVSQEINTLTWEIIIIDNNTTNSKSLISTYRKYYSFLPITLIFQPKLPHTFALCKARNLGLRLAQGKWIASIDADTIPNTKYLFTLEKSIKKWGNKSVIATSERIFIPTEKVSSKEIIKNPIVLKQLPVVLSPSNYGLPQDRRLPIMKSLPNTKHPWDYMHGCNVIYKRDIAIKIGGYNEIYDGQWGFEDIDFAYRMITDAKCISYYVKNLHVFHQDLPETKIDTNRMDKSINPNWVRICKKIPGYQEYKSTKYRQFSKEIKI